MKYKLVNYMEVEYGEIDRAIRQKYGKDPEIVPNEQWGNGESHSITVESNGRYDNPAEMEETFQKWLRGEEDLGFGAAHLCLWKLATDGLIPFGEYLVEVSWQLDPLLNTMYTKPLAVQRLGV